VMDNKLDDSVSTPDLTTEITILVIVVVTTMIIYVLAVAKNCFMSSASKHQDRHDRKQN